MNFYYCKGVGGLIIAMRRLYRLFLECEQCPKPTNTWEILTTSTLKIYQNILQPGRGHVVNPPIVLLVCHMHVAGVSNHYGCREGRWGLFAVGVRFRLRGLFADVGFARETASLASPSRNEWIQRMDRKSKVSFAWEFNIRRYRQHQEL